MEIPASHQGTDRPEANERFIDFIEGKARGAEALYVLGDLFETWIGDDDIVERFNAVVAGFFPERLPKNSAGTKQMATDRNAMIQSSV